MCDHVLDRQLSRGMFASDFGDSSRKHPTELARGRLENPPSKLEIQRATAILQVAQDCVCSGVIRGNRDARLGTHGFIMKACRRMAAELTSSHRPKWLFRPRLVTPSCA